jgi:hypothetical protein
MGRKDVENALSRLDMLTKEENLMVMMRNLEVTHHIDGAVCVVDGNVKATKLLTEDIDGNVKASMVLTEGINHNVNATKAHIHDVDTNVKATKVLVEDIDENVKEIEGVARGVDNSTQPFLSVFMHMPTFCPIMSQHSNPRA